MSLRKMMFLVAAMILLLPVSQVIAQESITCSDIEWSSAVTDKYPGVKDVCHDVVEKNGKVMAKIKVKIKDMNSDDISFRFVQTDKTLSDVYRVAAIPDWVERIRADMLDSGSNRFGMTINAYATEDRLMAIVSGKSSQNLAEAGGPIELRASVTESEPAAEVRSAEVMPDTAAPLPLIGLLGAGFIALGVGNRLFRRRFR